MGASLYRRALGDAYLLQSPAGQALHDAGTSRWTGICSVEGGSTMAARFVAGLFGLRWIVERFGIFTFDLEAVAAQGELKLLMRGMRCCGRPLPGALCPRIAAREWEAGGRFHFDVEIALPLAGRLVRYRGWLTDR